MEFWIRINVAGAPRPTVRRLLVACWKAADPQSQAPVLTGEHDGVYFATMESAVVLGAFKASLDGHHMNSEVLDGKPEGLTIAIRRPAETDDLLKIFFEGALGNNYRSGHPRS